ncbi:SusC/RagA family TonB-linked outer membrane protein, partial [Parabacteroides distasonis]
FGEAENNYIDRFNVRGNVDVKLNNFIKAYVNANATYYNSRSANGGSYWEKAATFRPNRVAPLIPLSYIDPNATQALTLIGTTKNYINGCFLGGAQTDLSNIFADYYFAGKNTWTSRQFQFDAGVDVDLSSVTKGLSFHTMVAVDYRTAYTTSFNDTYATFTPTWS